MTVAGRTLRKQETMSPRSWAAWEEVSLLFVLRKTRLFLFLGSVVLMRRYRLSRIAPLKGTRWPTSGHGKKRRQEIIPNRKMYRI